MAEVIDMTAEAVDTEKPLESGETEKTPTDSGMDKATTTTDYANLFSGLMEQYDVDTPEDLKEALEEDVSEFSKIRGVKVDEALEALEEKKAIMKRVAAKREQEQRENEEPDETIARLEKELKNERRTREDIEQTTKMREQSRKEVKRFDDDVKSFLQGSGLSKAGLNFAKVILTSKNPILDVPTGSKRAVKSFTKAGVDAISKFREQVIKEYEASKKEPDPKKKIVVPEGVTSAADPPKSKGTRRDKIIEMLSRKPR